MFWMRNKENSFPTHTLIWRPAFFSFCSQKKLDIRARSYKMLVRLANREDPDQTASEAADLSMIWVCPVCVGLVQNFSTFTVAYIANNMNSDLTASLRFILFASMM